MKKFLDLGNLQISNDGRVVGHSEEARDLTESEVRHVSGGDTGSGFGEDATRNWTWACDGSDPANTGGCTNGLGCDEERNTMVCQNVLSCELGRNDSGCVNSLDCDGASNGTNCQ